MRNKLFKKGFGLTDVLVAMVILGIGIASVAAVFVSGRTLLQHAEVKSEAMSIAFTKMEKYLTRSYLSLVNGSYSGTEGLVEWTVDIEEKAEGSIPYKEITVKAVYPEKRPSALPEYKRITLTNIIPYPYIHIEDESIGDTGQVVGSGAYQTINGLEIELSYPVDKDIMVIYNIAINVEDSSNIEADDTILTACFLDGIKRHIETRTPIITQPLINNIIEIDASSSGVTAGGNHTIGIRWKKDTLVAGAGTISIKRANLIVIAFEAKK